VAVLADAPNVPESGTIIEKVLNEAVKDGKGGKGELSSEADLREKVKKLLPPKKAKKATSGSGKNGIKPATSADLPGLGKSPAPAARSYEPSEDEEAKLDIFMDALEDAEGAGREIKAVLLKLDNKRKREFSKGLEWLCGLLTDIKNSTGY
jgi:hypothetical protein